MPESTSTSRSLLTFDDIQERLRCSRSHVYELTKAGVDDSIPTVRIRGRRYVREADLDAWLDRHAGQDGASAA